MNYTIYFHNMIETLPDIDPETERPTGDQLLDQDNYDWMLNKNLTIRFMKQYEYKNRNSLLELHFECWLSFNAKNDQDAIKKVEKVLTKNGFEWCCIYILLNSNMVTIHEAL